MPHAVRRGRAVASALVLVAVLALVGCAPGDGQPRLVTQEEAELLSEARLRNHEAGSRPFSFAVSSAGQDFVVSGWVDWRSGTGYGLAVPNRSDPLLLRWDALRAEVQLAPEGTAAPLPLPADGWMPRGLDPAGVPLDAVLAAVVELAAESADDPEQLVASGALRLGSTEAAGERLTLFALPPSAEPVEAPPDPEASSLRLQLDEDGLIVAAQLRVGGGWVDIGLGAADGTTIAPIPA